MKIDSGNKSVGTPVAKQPATSKPAPRQPEAVKATRVDISSLSARMQIDTAALADGANVVNAARVTELKQAISDGQFRINPEKIADGLLQSVREMLQRQR